MATCHQKKVNIETVRLWVMIQDEVMQDSVCFFWLYDLDSTFIDVLARTRPRYIPCEIHATGIEVTVGDARLEIRLENIASVDIVRFASAGAKVSVNVEIKFVTPQSIPDLGVATLRLFVVPMDVFRFDTSLRESRLFVSVLESLAQGVMPAIEPNPYLRTPRPKYIRTRANPDGLWNPRVPPYVYSEPPNLRHLIMVIALWLITVPFIVCILGLLGNLLLGNK